MVLVLVGGGDGANNDNVDGDGSGGGAHDEDNNNENIYNNNDLPVQQGIALSLKRKAVRLGWVANNDQKHHKNEEDREVHKHHETETR